jgi:hypothetical protein
MNYLRAVVWKLIGKKSSARTEMIAGEINVKVDFQYLYFEYITGLCPVYVDGPSQNVTPRALVFDLIVNLLVVLRNIRNLQTLVHEGVS